MNSTCENCAYVRHETGETGELYCWKRTYCFLVSKGDTCKEWKEAVNGME